MKYAKALVALLVPAAIAVEAVLNGGGVTNIEVEAVVTGVLGVVAVFMVPNKPSA